MARGRRKRGGKREKVNKKTKTSHKTNKIDESLLDDKSIGNTSSTVGEVLQQEYERLENNTKIANENADRTTSTDDAYMYKEISNVTKSMQENFIECLDEREQLAFATTTSMGKKEDIPSDTEDENCNSTALSIDMGSLNTQDADDMDADRNTNMSSRAKNPYDKSEEVKGNSNKVKLKANNELMEALFKGGTVEDNIEDFDNNVDINVTYERLLPTNMGPDAPKLYEENENDEDSTSSSIAYEDENDVSVDAILDTIKQDDLDNYDEDDDDDEYWNDLLQAPRENLSSEVRLVTWNAQNGLRKRVEPLSKYLANMQCDCAVIQEPTVARVNITEREMGRWRKAAAMYGYDMIITRHQWMLLKSRISKRLLGTPISVADGRILAVELSTGKTNRLLFAGVYGVVTGGSKSDGEIQNKDILRKDLHNKINKIRHDFEEKCEKEGMQPIQAILGDLQDTVTTGLIDNTCKGRKMHADSVLKWGLDSGMASIGYEWCRKKRLNYLTRQGTKGSTGIDHILGNEHLQSGLKHFGIDDYAVHLSVNDSDHHLLYADVEVSFKWKGGIIPASKSIKYGAIYTIPIVEVKNDENETSGFEYKSSKTEDELQNDEMYNLLSAFRLEMDTNETVSKKYQEALQTKEDIEKEMLRLARAEQDKCSLKLIPRTSNLRGKLNHYFDLLSTALDDTLMNMNLVRNVPAKHIGHATRKDTKVKVKVSDNKFIRMKNARSKLNKLHNALSIMKKDLKYIKTTVENCSDTSVNLPIQRMIKINKLNQHVIKKRRRIITAGVETLLELEQEIGTQVESIKSEERVNMKGLDPLDGSRANRQTTLHNYACRDDKPVLERMDKLMESIGDTNMSSKFIDQLQDVEDLSQESELEDDTSNDETSNNMNDQMPKGTSTETFWSPLNNILHWSNESDIKANVNPSFLCSYIGDIIITIEQSRKGVQRLIDRMNNSNLRRWLNDIRRDILANRLSGFTKSLIKEPNQAPEPHNKILIDADEPRDEFGKLLVKDATTVEEYLKATEQHHGNWAGDSGEEKYIHIIDEVIDIHGNTKFVVKKTRHPPTEEEMQKLYRKGRVLTDELQQHVRGAHNRETLDIFENRPKIDSNFRYPHTVDPSSDKVELKEIRKKFIKAISTGHSKARHKGFHLAILARMSFKWVELWMSCIEFILLTRMAPRLVKEMTRCPIPKPGKPGATRPLTIANDVWTFINSLIHDDLSSAIEKAGVLEDEIIAYRRGKGAMDAMLPIISMLEECHTSGETIALSSEDEEKFFDRVGLVIQIYTMMAIGLPDDGFLELKSEDMYERKCTVITKFGNVEITYEVGLPQGQTISVLTCNTVGHAKTDQWTMEHENNPTPWNKGFHFAVCDKLDEAYERVKKLLKFIYSDDATAIIAEGVKMSLVEKIQQNWRVVESSDETIADANLEELETLIQVEVDTYIQQQKDKLSKLLQTAESILNISGDFSKVTKIGRNSAKSDVAIINVDPSLVGMIPKCFKTSEHSFEKAGPVMGEVPVCYSIRRPKDDAPKEELEAYRNMIVIEKKLLGVVYGLNGDTAQTGRNGIKKAMIKIKETPIPNAGPKVAVTIANTYIITSTEWAILLAKYDMKNLNKLDKLIIQKLRRHFGLTKSDSAINLARPPSCFGGGLSSFADRYICGLLRSET